MGVARSYPTFFSWAPDNNYKPENYCITIISIKMKEDEAHQNQKVCKQGQDGIAQEVNV